MKMPNKQQCSFHDQQSKSNEHDKKPSITEIAKMTVANLMYKLPNHCQI